MAAAVVDTLLREELLERRLRLVRAAQNARDATQIEALLREVDAALARMSEGRYGLCEVCRGAVERERLLADPLTCVCLGCLGPDERRALEDDLELAARIQTSLLPARDFSTDGWRASYHYEAARLVSGDYLDLVDSEDGSLHFMLGDVSGHGIAASMLMAQLHTMFRTLVPLGLPLAGLVERASRLFCESTLPTHYATLVCGRAHPTGEVELCNAGHLPPLLVSGGEVTAVEATGLPIGVFCNEQFTSTRLHMRAGDTLLLYSDGLSEARDQTGEEYGTERLRRLLAGSLDADDPAHLVHTCLQDLHTFRAAPRPSDDLTLMAIKRS